MSDESVAELARLYLGNILYAIELGALSLGEQGKTEDAAYYRAIGRALAEAHGREQAAAGANTLTRPAPGAPAAPPAL